MEPVVYLNGELVAIDEARVPVSNPSFLHGVGLFETLRVYGGRPFRLEAHIERMRASARHFDMPVDDRLAEIAEAVRQVLDANQLAEARVRITVCPPGRQESSEAALLLVAAEATTGYPRALYEQGMSVFLCTDHRQSAQDPLAGHKTTSYFSRLLVLRNAQSRACGEALWFTPGNLLAEGCISNVFIVRNGTLLTPPVSTPVLPGVARADVLELARGLGIPAEERACTVDDLLDADEVLLTNSIMEVMPVTRIERKPIANEKPGPITEKLMQAYTELTQRK